MSQETNNVGEILCTENQAFEPQLKKEEKFVGVAPGQEKHQKPNVITIKIDSMSSGILVDALVPHHEQYEVVKDSKTGGYFHKTMNHTNIAQNNNKFYITQVLAKNKSSAKVETSKGEIFQEEQGAGADQNSKTEQENQKQYYLWNRWGRIGVPGQSMLLPLPRQEAIESHLKKVSDKTKNGYNIIQICY